MENKNISNGVKLISFSTGIQWFGWGLVEVIVPILVFKLTGSYTQSGFISSLFYISFLFTVPIAGYLADKINLKYLIISGFILYPFIGLLYFFAALKGSILLFILARFLNGIGYGISSIGRNTYFRLHNDNNVSTIFGYFYTIINLIWISGVILSIFLIKLFPQEYMFLFLTLMAIIAVLILFKLEYEPNISSKNLKQRQVNLSFEIHTSFFNHLKKLKFELRLLGIMFFFLGLMGVVLDFFMPIYAYDSGANLTKIGVIMIILAIPSLFSYYLGKIADRFKSKILINLFIFISIVMMIIPFANLFWQIVLIFLIAFGLKLLELTIEGIMTRATPKTTYGRVNGILSVINTLGYILGFMIFGIIIQKLGMQNSFILFTVISLIILVLIYRNIAKFEKIDRKVLK